MRVQFRFIWLCLNLYIFSEGCVQISLSSLGSGRARPGFSTPWFLVCFRSSALGWYDPSICLLLRSTHENRTTARASRKNTGMNRPDTLAELMMLHTRTCRNKHRLRHMYFCFLRVCLFKKTQDVSIRVRVRGKVPG